MNAIAITGPADLRDQRWLDERVEAARSGIEAVIDIALNWTEGRQVGRLHPGTAPADYVREHVGLVGRDAIVPLLTESNWSNRQIAAVTGVSHPTVGAMRTGKDLPVPAKTLGGDGKERPAFRPRLDPTPYIVAGPKPEPTPEPQPEEAPIEVIDNNLPWIALLSVMESIEAMTDSDASWVAATVPERRRAATAKRLRKLGTYLGRIAWSLEGKGGEA